MTGRAMDDLTEIVAIDGPAGTGKSTAARRVAERLGWAFLDTGAMYRAATWRVVNAGIDWDDREAIIASTREMDYRVDTTDGAQTVIVDGRDVTKEIRSAAVTNEIYRVDQIPEVRDRLVRLQRAMGGERPTVAEGRDMGTVVFPKAKCKVFLDASIDERARRRVEQLEASGQTADFETVQDEIAARDAHNRTRAIAPLRPADDAVIVDTTNLSLDEVVVRIVELAQEVFG